LARAYGECYGCTLNRGEYNIALGELMSQGWEIVPEAKEADLCLIYTCIVIDKTEKRVRRRIKQLKESGKRVVVGGCLAPFYQGERILPAFANCDTEGVNFRGVNGSPRVIDGKRAIVPISTGCASNCTYCVTKLARGGLKSYPVDSMIQDVKSCVERGAKEILLTSQDCGAFGFDNGQNIIDLVSRISELEGDFMVRIGMMNPSSIGFSIGELFDHEHIFKFLHLPLQSGSDDVLRRMGRRYTVEEFRSILDGYRRGVLSTDLIVGFPGETDDDFQETIKAVEDIRPDIMNITRFSPRPGTKAFEMDGKIHGRISKERSRILTRLSKKIGSEINSKWVGKRAKVIITERREDKKRRWMGRTESYKPLVFDLDGVELGSWVEARIVGHTSSYLIGEPCI
jgi:MiaB/RimO family radical SAM methylthiotransferase